MVQNTPQEEPTTLEALAREILDQTVNCGDSQELWTDTSEFPGITESSGITPEARVAMVRNTPLEELTMLEVLVQYILDQTVNCGDPRELQADFQRRW